MDRVDAVAGINIEGVVHGHSLKKTSNGAFSKQSKPAPSTQLWSTIDPGSTAQTLSRDAVSVGLLPVRSTYC
jgi:hypothetical protein